MEGIKLRRMIFFIIIVLYLYQVSAVLPGPVLIYFRQIYLGLFICTFLENGFIIKSERLTALILKGGYYAGERFDFSRKTS